MSDAVILAEIRSLRESFEARFLSHEQASSQRFDRFEESIEASFREGSNRMLRHSERIRAMETESDTHPALVPIAPATNPANPSPSTNPGRMPAWLVALITGAATLAGTQLLPLLLDALIWLLTAMAHPKVTP